MFASVAKSFLGTCTAAKDVWEESFGEVAAKAGTGTASNPSLTKVLTSLEGLCIQVKRAPDIYVTILEVHMPNGTEPADLSDFMLKGFKCRTQLEVTGTAAQVAGMMAAKTTKKILRKAIALTGVEIPKIAVESTEKMRETLAGKASEEPEKKSVEFNMNVDLEVKEAGKEVVAVVHIAPDAFKAIERVVPVATAATQVEEAIATEVQQAIKNYT